MKKILLLACLLMVSITMNAQFTVEDDNGDPVVEGDMVVYGTTTYPEASFDYFVNNTSTTDDINMRIEFVSAVNADGSMMELCFGECYTSIVIGESYPVGLDVVVPPGGQTGLGNHFYNADPGNGTDMLDYVFRFFQVDSAGNEIGTSLTMSYRYDPSLGVDDVNQLDFSIDATVVNNELRVNTNEILDITIYDLQGRAVQHQSLHMGQQTINVSHLSSQLYIVQFTNDYGVSESVKIVVK